MIECADNLPKSLFLEYFIIFVQEDMLHTSKRMIFSFEPFDVQITLHYITMQQYFMT